MDVNEVTAKSMQFRIGEDIIQICGRRVRGMSTVEVRCLLETYLGTVKFHVAREPTFAFGKKLGDTLDNIFLRIRSDFQLWTLEEEKTADVPDSLNVIQETSSQCKIIDILMKDGKNLSASYMERTKGKSEATMRKSQVMRRRAINPASWLRRSFNKKRKKVVIYKTRDLVAIKVPWTVWHGFMKWSLYGVTKGRRWLPRWLIVRYCGFIDEDSGASEIDDSEHTWGQIFGHGRLRNTCLWYI